MKKILLSGVKPTGIAHIGNYFGAMKQFVDLQDFQDGTSDGYQCYFMIADYYGLNLIQNGEEMRRLTLDLALDYLAIGIDPSRSILFKQSDVSAHTELTWIFDTLVTIPYLARAHAFKAAVEKLTDATVAQRHLSSKLEQLTDINVGTFNYPVLMAADILLYDTDVVPVGQDQKQHVEYARDIALKFNHTFCRESISTFKLPEPLIIKDVAVVPGINGRKMSKSYGNTIPLFATRGETEADLTPLYDAHKGQYKALKEALIEDIDAFLKPMRERRAQLKINTDKVLEILKNGAERAGKQADAKLLEVKKIIGVTP